MVAGSIAGKTINVIDAQTEEPAWTLEMDLGIRPMTFATNPDGSTKWIFAQLTGLQRVRGRRFRDAQGNQADQESGSAAREERRSRKDPIRRTAWRSPRTARRWSSAAG